MEEHLETLAGFVLSPEDQDQIPHGETMMTTLEGAGSSKQTYNLQLCIDEGKNIRNGKQPQIKFTYGANDRFVRAMGSVIDEIATYRGAGCGLLRLIAPLSNHSVFESTLDPSLNSEGFRGGIKRSTARSHIERNRRSAYS